MNKEDRKKWADKSEKLNRNILLQVGMEVVDIDGCKGVVVQVRTPRDETDEGRVAVWQIDRFRYGEDNCEQYAYREWKMFLRAKLNLKNSINLAKDCYFHDSTGNTPYMYKLEGIVAIEGEFCIAKASPTLPNCELPHETLVFNVETKEVLQEKFRFWQVTDDSRWVAKKLQEQKEQRLEPAQKIKVKM